MEQLLAYYAVRDTVLFSNHSYQFGFRSARREPMVVRPGRAVRGSTSGRPIMAALDLLGRRWVLRVLWELRQSPRGFVELRRACDDMSSSVLATRLGELVAANLVEEDDMGYRLSPLGEELGTALDPLLGWSKRWAQTFVDPSPAAPDEF
jgi:DNA-binding HxlR family transcriptional regulator